METKLFCAQMAEKRTKKFLIGFAHYFQHILNFKACDVSFVSFSFSARQRFVSFSFKVLSRILTLSFKVNLVTECFFFEGSTQIQAVSIFEKKILLLSKKKSSGKISFYSLNFCQFYFTTSKNHIPRYGQI